MAVLPFQNLSGDPQNEYFSDGTTEEIITKLSSIKNLEVTSRTSVTRYKGTQKDVKEIGRELGVRYILEGSVRKAENRVRITAQLIDSSTGFHLWAQEFDRDLKDVFSVQEETALNIAEALKLQLSPQEQQAVHRRYTENVKAYDAFLRGKAMYGNAFDRPERLEAARKDFEEALRLDPELRARIVGSRLGGGPVLPESRVQSQVPAARGSSRPKGPRHRSPALRCSFLARAYCGEQV